MNSLFFSACDAPAPLKPVGDDNWSFFFMAGKPVWRSWFWQKWWRMFRANYWQILLITGLLSATCTLQQVKYRHFKLTFSDCLSPVPMNDSFFFKPPLLSQMTFINSGKRILKKLQPKAFSLLFFLQKMSCMPYYIVSHVRNCWMPYKKRRCSCRARITPLVSHHSFSTAYGMISCADFCLFFCFI